MKKKQLFANSAKTVFNLIYRMFDCLPRNDEVLFVSRKTDTPSRDFVACGEELATRGLKPVYLTKRLTKGTVVPYAFHALREIYHLARCRVCFVDRYDPMIGLIDFKSEHDVGDTQGAVHVDYPVEPMVIQLWHAFGAFKKFGYQSADTTEGHTSDMLHDFGVHDNYSWVICSGDPCREAFAQAFSYPLSRVLPLCRPEYYELLASARNEGAEKKSGQRPKVLMAPTLRKSEESKHPFHDLRREIEDKGLSPDLRLEWCFHPLEQGGSVGGEVSESLLDADYVVTDYSSIVYEAFLLNKRLAFFVPDLDEYRVSPGLNADPDVLCADLVFTTAEELLATIEAWDRGGKDYPQEQLEAFAANAFSGAPSDPAVAIADFVEAQCLRANER